MALFADDIVWHEIGRESRSTDRTRFSRFADLGNAVDIRTGSTTPWRTMTKSLP
jgi:hypothetical protein